MRGEVIGIVAARVGDTANERSFSFAIPSAAVIELLLRLRKVGQLNR